jgi:hypothetical protein
MEARLAAAVASQDASALSLLQKDLLSDRTSCDAATAGLLFLKDQLRALPAAFNDWVIAVSEEVVAALRPRIVEFENADYHFRYLIWSCAWGVRAPAPPPAAPNLFFTPPPPPPSRTRSRATTKRARACSLARC